MIFRPWVEWGFTGDKLTWTARYPLMPWEIEDGGVGGHATAASGIEEAYVIREDEIVHATLRVEEDEMVNVRAWLRWARRAGQTFLFRFDVADASTQHEYWLHSPVWPETIRAERDPDYLRVFRVQVGLRREVGAPITTTWAEF